MPGGQVSTARHPSPGATPAHAPPARLPRTVGVHPQRVCWPPVVGAHSGGGVTQLVGSLEVGVGAGAGAGAGRGTLRRRTDG